MEEDENKLNESFISRWSKRKSGVVSDENNQELNENFKKEEGKNKKKTNKEDTKDNNYEELNDQELLEKFKLPNPDKIKKEKGLDVFFKDGVPDRLRQIALRRVWKLNPIIRFADSEINDYHEDFTDAATVIEGMQTAYQVGKGYLSEILENKDEETHAEKPKIEKLGTKAKIKKKTRLTSKKKERNVKDEQVSISHEKSDENKNKNDTSETDNQKLGLEIAENESLETAPKKPKPKMMVFKPKDNDNDYQ